MRRTTSAALALGVTLALSIGTLVLASPGEAGAPHRRRHVEPPAVEDPTIAVEVAAALEAEAVHKVELAVYGLEISVGEYVASVVAAEEAEREAAAVLARTRANPPRSSSTSGRGPLTQEQLAALNVCEASGENGWRTGRYGLETGTNDVGSWPIERQQAEVQRIYAEHGASAWGVDCRDEIGG